MANSGVAELEHFIGYGGKHLSTVRYHPVQPEILIYGAANAIIIEDVNDPHKQEFLRGHDAEVSAIDVSANGKLLASGQVGSQSRKGAVAPIVIWEFDKRQRFIEFNGLAHSVLCVKFSPDGRFLVGTGANQMIYVWDVSTGEVVYSRRTESPCYLGVWGNIIAAPSGSRYPSYILCTTYDSQVFVHTMSFDIGSMCYTLGSEVVQFPSSGLQRKHICGLVRGDFLITGTAAGDMCVFSLKTKVFRTSLPVCNNGVTCITQYGDFLYIAGGDGKVKALRGNDTEWHMLADNLLEAGALSLTPSSDGAELVAATKNGKFWRLLTSDLTASLQSASHTGAVTDIAFGNSSDIVATASEAGEVFIMDLSDYMPKMAVMAKSPCRTIVFRPSDQELLAGYDDGYMRAWSVQQGAMLWQILTHRGGVTVVRESNDFIATGGNDCAMRVWHRSTHENVASFTHHRKPIADLKIDEAIPHTIHSASEDKQLVTYDLKQNKAIVQHYTQSSQITSLSQRKDKEREILSCSLDGRILFWDVDYPDPTGCLESPADTLLRLRCCEISPSGRYIAAGSEDCRLYVYDLVTCQCIQECEGHAGGVVQVRWSPDQRQIVTAGRDGCTVVWNFFEV